MPSVLVAEATRPVGGRAWLTNLRLPATTLDVGSRATPDGGGAARPKNKRHRAAPSALDFCCSDATPLYEEVLFETVVVVPGGDDMVNDRNIQELARLD